MWNDAALAFLSILLEGLPFVLLGTLFSGLIEVWVPAQWLSRFLPRGTFRSIIMCGGLGMVFPVCECGVVPVIRRLMVKGLPVSCAVTYMLAAPIVNPVVMISTLAAFRGQEAWLMTGMRLGMGFTLAVAVGIVLLKTPWDRILRPHVGREIMQQADALPAKESFARKLRRALAVSCRDFIDVSCYLVLGAALAAAFNVWMPQEWVASFAQNTAAAVASLMALAGVLSLCSTSDAFIAATFFAFPAVAKLAFLVFGPMVDIKLLLLYSSVFRIRFVAALSVGLAISIWLLCWRMGGGW